MKKYEMEWHRNHEWYNIDEDGSFFMTEAAPKETLESFRRYQKQLKHDKIGRKITIVRLALEAAPYRMMDTIRTFFEKMKK